MPPAKNQINQKLIGEVAGVSQATVSLVLSGRAVNSEATRRRVLETARRLKYRPNLLVHGMQTGKTKMIGVMAPPFDFFWSEVLYGIHDTLIAADHVPLCVWTAHDGPGPRNHDLPRVSELDQIHRLLDRRVDGVILWPPFAAIFSDHVEEFSSRNTPVVTIDHELPPRYKADYVCSDESSGAEAVAKHLVDLGHERIGYLAAADAATWAVNRRRAFEQAMKAYPHVSLKIVDAPAGQDWVRASDSARQLLEGPDRPTAIYTAKDLYAKVLYQTAAELGLRIPQDLSVVGHSDDGFAHEMSPPLTTVRQPAYQIGQKSAELVLARAQGKVRSTVSTRALLPVQLIVRESTAKPPAA